MIKAVLIDVDNTLLDFNLSAGAAMEKCCERFGITFTAEFLPTFIRINDGLWAKIERGELTVEGLHEMRWNTVFAVLGVNFDGKIFEKAFLSALFDTAIPIEGALDIVKYLSEKYVLCTASNAVHAQQMNRLKISGILPYLSHVFDSEQIGVKKPDPRFFDACLNALSPIKKDEIVLIGDSLSADISGANVSGIKAVWFNRYDKAAPAGVELFAAITTLGEIKNVL